MIMLKMVCLFYSVDSFFQCFGCCNPFPVSFSLTLSSAHFSIYIFLSLSLTFSFLFLFLLLFYLFFLFSLRLFLSFSSSTTLSPVHPPSVFHPLSSLSRSLSLFDSTLMYRLYSWKSKNNFPSKMSKHCALLVFIPLILLFFFTN